MRARARAKRLAARTSAALMRCVELRFDGDERSKQLLGTLDEHEQLFAARTASRPRTPNARQHYARALERAADARVQRPRKIARVASVRSVARGCTSSSARASCASSR